MKFLTLVSVVFSFSFVHGQQGIINGRVDKVTNLITLAGFLSETHLLETEDGYQLKVHRIFPKVVKERKGPVLLIHGMFGSSADFVMTGPNIALGFQLSNEGYDVWLGNVRGSKYSMKHRSINPLSSDFWQFSFHEMGVYDLPAMMNYILATTQKPSLFYVGHNQGTTALLVLLSTKPDYNAKILNAHLLSPIGYMDYPHPLVSLEVKDTLLAAELVSKYNFNSLIEYSTMLINTYCPDRSPATMMYCTNLWFFLFGRNINQTEIDPALLYDIPSFISPTASTNQFHHYLQLSQSGKFQSFDNNRRASMYNRFSSASDYNLLNVKAPLYLYHAAEDLVVSRLDVERLKATLTTNVREYRIIPNWNHMDFVYSSFAKGVLYNNMIISMNNEQLDFIGYIKNIFG